jgi:hypothetical protein
LGENNPCTRKQDDEQKNPWGIKKEGLSYVRQRDMAQKRDTLSLPQDR